jgi:hypothetical protein
MVLLSIAYKWFFDTLPLFFNISKQHISPLNVISMDFFRYNPQKYSAILYLWDTFLLLKYKQYEVFKNNFRPCFIDLT